MSEAHNRRRPTWRPATESLETRNLLTGGGGNTFALLTGTVASAGQPAVVKFVVDSPRFQLSPRGSLIGFDVAAARTSNLAPEIQGIRGPGVTPRSVETFPKSDVVLAQIPGMGQVKARTYQVLVRSATSTTGDFLVGFYLPGDADGSGVVNTKDVNIVKKSLNQQVGDSKYSFDADADRNGKINQRDLQITQRNLGAKTTVLPVVSANLDPLTDSGPADRKTGIRAVSFTGEATPGAKLKFTEINGKAAAVEITARNDGTYSAPVSLADGDNIFRLEATDAFGQKMAGQLAKVVYDPTLTATPPDALAYTSPVTPKGPQAARKS